MKYVIPFSDNRAVNPDLVGRKFASLARAHRMGFAVPNAAVISTEAHLHFSVHQSWPEGLFAEVLRLTDMLDLSRGISIRSSAVQEDLENQSFAGQYRSFLNVHREDDLQNKIVQCWQSTDTKSVESYIRLSAEKRTQERLPLMAVILQRMVKAVASGVAFGCHPVKPVSEEVVIEAVHGLAEPLVSGHLSPIRAYVGPDGGTRVERPESDAGPYLDPLDSGQWQQIAGMLRKLEGAFGQGHLDIEWAVDEFGKLWLLQSRPITTFAEVKPNVPPGTWTRKIANDLWADRLTPFLARVLMKNQERFTLTRVRRILGLQAIRPTLTVIDGYLYLNCESIRQVVSLISPRFRTSDLKALFSDEDEFEKIRDAGFWTRVLIGMRAIFLFVAEPEANPFICLIFHSSHHKKIQKMLKDVRLMPDQTPVEALRRTLCALEVMASIQENNQWPYSHATVFTWLLRWLSVDLAGFSYSEFLDSIAKQGRNVTIFIERQFRRMVDAVEQDWEFRDRMLTEPPESLLANLPPAFEQMFNRFLSRYGCRSRHRALYVRRWAEAPEEVIAIIQNLVRQRSKGMQIGPDPHPVGLQRIKRVSHSKQSEDRTGVSEKVPTGRGTGSVIQRWMLPMVARLTIRFLDLREELRFLLDEALFEIRRSILTLGQVTGLEESVMFLHAEELQKLVKGDMSVQNARMVADERYRQYHESAEIHPYYVDGIPREKALGTKGVLRGIGTSPGRVTGRARIVHDPTDANLRIGEILIAKNTDPGWTPILSMVNGIVVEEGGLLNHCSIVARELKIPAIVGIRKATLKIRDGDLITIDGGLGLVQMEES